MAISRATLIREYLQAIESIGPLENVVDFFAQRRSCVRFPAGSCRREARMPPINLWRRAPSARRSFSNH